MGLARLTKGAENSLGALNGGGRLTPLIYLHKRSRLCFCFPQQLTPACRENSFALATRSSRGQAGPASG